MKITILLLLGVLAALLAAPLALAQESPFRGSITTGYRFTDVKGYEPKYQELFDLNGGLLSERFTIFGGFSYDSLLATDFVNFLRGTAPITNVGLRNQTVERVWQGGVHATPRPRLSISFSGNFLRATGMGEIAGETPLYGPVTFPYATGSVHYDVPRIGRMMLQVQRTYYTEQIVAGNNFSANLLTIAWTRSFGK